MKEHKRWASGSGSDIGFKNQKPEPRMCIDQMKKQKKESESQCVLSELEESLRVSGRADITQRDSTEACGLRRSWQAIPMRPSGLHMLLSPILPNFFPRNAADS